MISTVVNERDSRLDHPKCRRRRRKADRQSISAWLTLDDRLKTNVGLLSRDLYADLFEGSASDEEDVVRYVSITPWSPGTQDGAHWTTLPVKAYVGDGESHSTIRFSATSITLQNFTHQIQTSNIFRPRSSENRGIEIRILDVEPLVLDEVFINVDGEQLRKHDEVQERFGGGFHSQTNGYAAKGKGRSKHLVNGHGGSDGVEKTSREDQLTTVIRAALATSKVIRQGDLLRLPLPTHPITHASFPPAKITFCEPVDQGLLASNTKIIVNRESRAEILRKTPSRTDRIIRTVGLEDEANEQFHSALEDSRKEEWSVPDEDHSLTSPDSSSDSGSSSDNSFDGAFPMGASGLGATPFGLNGAKSFDSRGGFDTPKSAHSNYSSTTARQTLREKGKLFKLKPLLGRVPEDMLHPKPSIDEDEETRVYVDIRVLMKLGAFSGDWVRIRASQIGEKEHWGIDAFNGIQENEDFRVAKVYGLPNISAAMAPRYPKGDASVRRSSVSTMTSSASRPTSEAWLSPILFANLGSPDTVRLSPLAFAQQENSTGAARRPDGKVPASSVPPIAKELKLLMVSTPLTTEQILQAGLMAATKQYFQTKQRILHQGDLVAIPFDVGRSRILAQASTSPDSGAQVEELLSEISNDKTSLGVAWFRVQHTVGADGQDGLISANSWSDAVIIDPSITRMAQAGNEQSKIPTPESGYEYYLGLKPAPRTSSSKGLVDPCTGSAPKAYISPLRRRLRELIAATTSPRATHLGIDPMVILLHSNQRNIGKSTLATDAVCDLGCHTFVIDAYELLSEGGPGGGDVKTEGIFQARIERALTCGPQYTAVLIRHIEALIATRMITALKAAIPSTRLIIATTTEIDQLPESLRSIFTHELTVFAPDEPERLGLLHNIITSRSLPLATTVSLSSLALKTAAFVAGDLADITDRAITARRTRLTTLLTTNATLSSNPLLRDILLTTPSAKYLLPSDFETALAAARSSFATSISAPKIPSVQWSDVGGLSHIKAAIMETIHLPLSRPDLFAPGLKKRSGILLYGPPGTGKTLLAKAIATEFSLNFFSIKGPELLNMYIGESEANVRRVFQRARDARPCVVFFDELDSVAPKRGNQGDSGGVMDRIVSQLLAELDGMSDGDDGGRGGVFVIGATNRPDLLDQALLRPGRFDKMLYLGIPDSHKKQLTILQALTRKFNLDPSLSLARVADHLPFTYTGADLYALASDAMLKAITRRADAVDAKIKSLPSGPVSTAYFFDHLATDDDIAVTVTKPDFEAARQSLVGSVSVKELEHYARVRKAFEGSEIGSEARNKRPPLESSPTAVWAGKQVVEGEKAGVGGKGKGKASDHDAGGQRKGMGRGKGKGKAPATWESSDEEDDDEAYETSHDYLHSPERRGGQTGFRDGAMEDEEGLYE